MIELDSMVLAIIANICVFALCVGLCVFENWKDADDTREEQGRK